MSRQRPWTDREMAALARLCRGDLTLNEVAARIGRTYSSTLSAIKRLRRRGVMVTLLATDRTSKLDRPGSLADEGFVFAREAERGCDAHLEDLRASGGGWPNFVIRRRRSVPMTAADPWVGRLP